MRTVEDYLRLPYRIVLTHDKDEDGNEGFVASVDELSGCLSQGASPEEAVRGIYDAMAGWVSVAVEDGLDIPEPPEEGSYSGKFVLRVPQSLHAELVRAAEREGVSLNQFASSALAGSVEWRRSKVSA
jgi:antitoxin HicB